MSIFDLVFIALFLCAVGTLVVAGVAAMRHRYTRARTLLRRLGASLVAYLAIVVCVALATPQRFTSPGKPQCADDWCIAVQDHRQLAVPGGTAHDVTFRLSSRALRVPQRERYVVVYLVDTLGHRHDMEQNPSKVPFDTLLEPGEKVDAERRFVVPSGTPIVGLVVTREGGGRFPVCCIIGDEGSFFHKRTIVRFE